MIHLRRKAGGKQLVSLLVGDVLLLDAEPSPVKADGSDPPNLLELLASRVGRVGREHVHPTITYGLSSCCGGAEFVAVRR